MAPPGRGDDVEGGHDQAGAVAQHPDLAVQAHVVQPGLLGAGLERVDAGGVLEGGALGVAEGGVVVEADLAVQGEDVSLGGGHEGVDLDQGGVLGGEDLPEPADDGGHGVGEGAGLEAGGLHDARGDVVGDALKGVDADAGQGLGMLGGEGLDVHAAVARAHGQIAALGAVQEEGDVELRGDLDAAGDQDGADGVALDVHAEDLGGPGPGLLGAAGEFDAPGLAAPAGLDLRLDNDQARAAVEQILGGPARLVGRGGECAGRHGDPVPVEQVPCLVLVQVHAVCRPSGSRSRWRGGPAPAGRRGRVAPWGSLRNRGPHVHEPVGRVGTKVRAYRTRPRRRTFTAEEGMASRRRQARA